MLVLYKKRQIRLYKTVGNQSVQLYTDCLGQSDQNGRKFILVGKHSEFPLTMVSRKISRKFRLPSQSENSRKFPTNFLLINSRKTLFQNLSQNDLKIFLKKFLTSFRLPNWSGKKRIKRMCHIIPTWRSVGIQCMPTWPPCGT